MVLIIFYFVINKIMLLKKLSYIYIYITYQKFQAQVEPSYNKENKVMIELSCILLFIYHLERLQHLFHQQYPYFLFIFIKYLIKDHFPN